MEYIECIFCNKSSENIVIKENGYMGRQCPECGLIFISPRPTFSEILELYSEDKALVSAEIHMSDAFTKRLQAKQNLSIIRKFIRSGSMLEIGAGAGYFLDEARKIGFEVYGIELNKKLATFINRGLGIQCKDTTLNGCSFGGKSFDIIYHSNLLSHLHDPIAEFKKINNKLKDNGILAFETGNIGDVKPKYYPVFSHFGYPDHLFFFSENNFMALLKITGFELLKIYRYSILGSLLTHKIKQKVKHLIISSISTNIALNKNTSMDLVSNTTSSNFKQAIKTGYRIMLHFLSYKIGYILPKKGRPQTVLVVARKK